MNKEEFDFTNPQKLRIKAEAILKEKQQMAEHEYLESDLKKLLHELQVHQVELEMQNEELQNAYQSTQEALKKYTLLYDFAPLGYMTIGCNGTILELNFSAAELIGEKRISLKGSNFKQFITIESKPIFHEFLNKVCTDDLKQTTVLWLSDGFKPSIKVYLEGVYISEDDTCIISFLDLSSIKEELSDSH
jgi:PAS domain-containing protein